MSTLNYSQAVSVLRKTVTVPAFAGTADTLASLASLTADEKARCIGVKVSKLDSAGANRGAMIVGDVVGTLPQQVAAGEAYYEPAMRDAVNSYVKAAAGAALTNTVVLFYMLANAQ